MKIGFRIPSLSKRIAARTSVKRYVRQSMEIKAPRGYGWITNPKKYAYNKIYNKTTKGCMMFLFMLVGVFFLLLSLIIFVF
ncbi:MAG: hypothetical protein HXX18_08080 [Bacteroidetes bacterium]|nr:hypothetical protein [Bacteroidota bacterium]